MLALPRLTKAKVVAVTPLAIKMGQKDTLPALSFRLNFKTTNHELNQLDPTGKLRELFFQKGTSPEGQKKQQQAQIDGVEEISDLPALTAVAIRLGRQKCTGEQTGCSLLIDRGLGDKKSNVKLDAVVVKKLEWEGQEGGTVEWWVTLNTSATDELDDVTFGRLTKLKKKEIRFTLEGPMVDQTDLEESTGATITPITALSDAVQQPAGEAGNDEDTVSWPFPTDDADKKVVDVTVKKSRSVGGGAAAH